MDAPLVPIVDVPADSDEDFSGVRREIADLKSQLNRIESTLGGTR